MYKAYNFWLAVRARVEEEEGQAMVEYALILALISIVSLVVLTALGVDIKNVFKTVETAVSGSGVTPTP